MSYVRTAKVQSILCLKTLQDRYAPKASKRKSDQYEEASEVCKIFKTLIIQILG